MTYLWLLILSTYICAADNISGNILRNNVGFISSTGETLKPIAGSLNQSRLVVWIPFKQKNMITHIISNAFKDFKAKRGERPNEPSSLSLFSISSQDLSLKNQCISAQNSVNYNNIPCPTIILTGAMNLAYLREKHYLKPLESYINKMKDPRIETRFRFREENETFAIPFISDIRVLAFNKTTFDKLGLKLPPPYDNWGPEFWKSWNWSKFLDFAKKIKNGGYSEGFRFKSSWNEENYLMSIIANSQQVSITTNGTLSVKFQEALKETLHEFWGEGNLANSDFLPENNLYVESAKLQKDLFGPGMSIVPFSAIKEIQKTNPDILPAYVPAKNTVQGGFGLCITKRSKYQDFGFEFIEFLTSPNNPYLSYIAHEVGLPPPYMSELSKSPWSSPEWKLQRDMLLSSIPISLTYKEQEEFLVQKPFRQMMIGVAYNSQREDPRKEALERASTCENTIVVVKTTCDANPNFISFVGRNFVTPECSLNVNSVQDAIGDIPCPFILPNSSIGLSTTIGSAVGIVAAILFLYLFFQIRDTLDNFVVFTLIINGGIILLSSNFFFLGMPNKVSCIGQIVGPTFGFTTMFGLLSKFSIFQDKMVKYSFLVLNIVNWSLTLGLSSTQVDAVDESIIISGLPNSVKVQLKHTTCIYGNVYVLIVLVGINMGVILLGGIMALRRKNMKLRYSFAYILFFTAIAAIITIFVILLGFPRLAKHITSIFFVIIGVVGIFNLSIFILYKGTRNEKLEKDKFGEDPLFSKGNEKKPNEDDDYMRYYEENLVEGLKSKSYVSIESLAFKGNPGKNCPSKFMDSFIELDNVDSTSMRRYQDNGRFTDNSFFISDISSLRSHVTEDTNLKKSTIAPTERAFSNYKFTHSQYF